MNHDHHTSYHNGGKNHNHVSGKEIKNYEKTTTNKPYKSHPKTQKVVDDTGKKTGEIIRFPKKSPEFQKKAYNSRHEIIADLFASGKNEQQIFNALKGFVSQVNDFPENKASLDAFDSWVASQKVDVKKVIGKQGISLFELQKAMEKKLEGDALEKRKERIKKIAPRVFQEAITHGIVDKSGNIHSKSDIDGSASIFLLQQFGIIKNKKIKYVVPGEKKIGAINVDTGKANGIKIETKTPNSLFGSTLIIDQHPNGPSSSTQVVYHALKTLGAIDTKNQLWLERFIDFVNIIDLLGYEVVSADMKHKPYTLLGLHKKLMSMGTKGLHIIMNYFKNNPYATGLEFLNDKQLSRMLDGNPFEENKKEKSSSSSNLVFSSKMVEKEILGAQERFESLKKQKKIVEYMVVDKKQKFIVDNRIVERKNEKGELIAENFLPNGVETALSQGFGLYQVKPSGDVYIYSPIEFGEDLKGIGEQIRGKILLLKKPKDSNKDGMEKYNEQLGKLENTFGINIKKEKKSPKTQSNETLPIQNSDAIKKDIDTHWDRDNEIVRIEEGANPQIILQMGSYEIPLSKDDLGEGLEQLVTFYKEHKKQGVKIVFNLSTLEANVL